MKKVILLCVLAVAMVMLLGTQASLAAPGAQAGPAEMYIRFFKPEDRTIEPGQCLGMYWLVQGSVERVYLDGDLVPPYGEKIVCPTEGRTYYLLAINAYTVAWATSEIRIVPPPCGVSECVYLPLVAVNP